MKRTALLLVMMALCLMASAQQQQPPRQARVPAVPHPVEWIQPSGDTLTIRIIGDERWSCRTTLDGYIVVENRDKVLCYAKLNCKGEYRPTCIVAHDAGHRTARELRYLRRMDRNPKLKRNDGER